MPAALQRILFPMEEWNDSEVIRWLVSHNFYPLKITKEGNYYHARIRVPRKKARYAQKKTKTGIIFTFMY